MTDFILRSSLLDVEERVIIRELVGHVGRRKERGLMSDVIQKVDFILTGMYIVVIMTDC